MKVTNEHGMPQALYRAVSDDAYPHGAVGDLSVTTLIGPPQIARLRKDHSDEITIDATERIWMALGTAMHRLLEQGAAPGDIVERRYFVKVDDMTISGQVDHISSGGVLSDYKFCGVFSTVDGIKTEWLMQARINAWLAKKNGVDVQRAQIAVIFRDWMASKAQSGGSYPPVAFKVFKVNLVDDGVIESFIRARIAAHKAEKPMPCTFEERWASDPVYAVHATERKSAHRLLNTEEAAKSWIAANQTRIGRKLEVVFRPGDSKRCRSYCEVAPFCPQWKADPANKP